MEWDLFLLAFGVKLREDDSDSTTSSAVSDCTFDTENVSSATEYSDIEMDDDMPPLTDVSDDDDDEEEEIGSRDPDMPTLTTVDDDDEEEDDSDDEETEEVTCEAKPEERVFVTTTFKRSYSCHDADIYGLWHQQLLFQES